MQKKKSSGYFAQLKQAKKLKQIEELAEDF
jgi:hypothetical protein